MPKTTVERLRDLGSGRRDAIMMDPSIIQIEKDFNPRNYLLKENREHLDELKASIKMRGVLQPLLVRYDPQQHVAVLCDGECRLRAVMELRQAGVPIETVPVLQVQGGNEIERLVLALTANTGKPLSKWESGAAFRRLANYGWPSEKIANELGFSERFVNEAIELSDAPEEVKVLLSERAVTPSLALYHIRKSGAGATATLRGKVEEARAKGKKVAKRSKQAPAKERNLLSLVKKLLSDITDEQLTSTEFDYVEVKRKRLLAVSEFVKA